MYTHNLTWNDLTLEEKDMAERQLLSIYEDWAYDGDEYDKEEYEKLLNNRFWRHCKLLYCKFTRITKDNSTSIEVWL